MEGRRQRAVVLGRWQWDGTAQGRSDDFHLENAICMQPRSPAAKLFLSALWGLVRNEHSSLTAALAGLLTTPRLTPLQTPFSLWHPADRLALIQARSGLLQTPKYPFSSEQSSEGRAEVKSARYYRANTRSYCSCCFSAVNCKFSTF